MQSGMKVMVMRTDGGGEFISIAFRAWLADKGVTMQTTPPNLVESNGNSKRLNRTLQDKCRTMMVAAAVPGYLWEEFMMAANTLRNVTPVSNLECTPYQKWTGHTPDISKLRVLGSKFSCQIDKKKRHGKFQPVAYKAVLVGYTMSSNSYRVWDPVKHTIYNVGSPTFDEAAKPGWWRKSTAAAALVADEQVVRSGTLVRKGECKKWKEEM